MGALDTRDEDPLRAASETTSRTALGGDPNAAEFMEMRQAYRATGGLARGDDIARLLDDHHRGNFISLARLIAGGEVFGFEWRGTFWIPVFQFDLGSLTVKPGPRSVLREVGHGWDGWSLATWYAQANDSLDGRRPVDLIDSNLRAVREAARAARDGWANQASARAGNSRARSLRVTP